MHDALIQDGSLRVHDAFVSPGPLCRLDTLSLLWLVPRS
jgi:hypothetical protein